MNVRIGTKFKISFKDSVYQVVDIVVDLLSSSVNVICEDALGYEQRISSNLMVAMANNNDIVIL